MLVVIVVAAATAFAIFVAAYEKQLLTQEGFAHDQSLESIHVLSLTTTISSGSFHNFSFIVNSESVNPSTVIGISVNNNPLYTFGWYNLTTRTPPGTYTAGQAQNFVLSPFDEVNITVGPCAGPAPCSFLNGNEVPQPGTYVKIDVYTLLDNDFSRVFLPPTALEVVSEINPSGSSPIVLLDGSMSFQQGGNATIVEWSWEVTNQTDHTHPSTSFTGEEVEVSVSMGSQSGPMAPGDTYWVNLTVTNSVGFDSFISLLYTVPG